MKAIYAAPVAAESRHARWARCPVAAVMSTPVLTASRSITLDQALRRMLAAGYRHLAIVDAQGRYVGVLAARAIAAASAGRPGLDEVTAGEVLGPEAAVLGCRALVLDAARLMRSAAVDAVAVVDDTGGPIGMLTSSDVIKLIAA